MSALLAEVTDAEKAAWQIRTANTLVALLAAGSDLGIPPLEWGVGTGLLLIGRVPVGLGEQDARELFMAWCALIDAAPGPEHVGAGRTVLRAEVKPFRDNVAVLLICEFNTP